MCSRPTHMLLKFNDPNPHALPHYMYTCAAKIIHSDTVIWPVEKQIHEYHAASYILKLNIKRATHSIMEGLLTALHPSNMHQLAGQQAIVSR